MTKKVKRILKNITFPAGSHVAYTSWSQGGAASELNDPYLLKGKVKKELSPEEKQMLIEMGYKESDLVKAKSDRSLISSPSGEEINKTNVSNTGNEEIMSEDVNILKQRLADQEALTKQLVQQLKVTGVEKALSKYSFDEAEVSGLAEALASMKDEDQSLVYKAFDSITNKLNTEKAAKEEAISKSKGDEATGALAGLLSKEAGSPAEAVVPTGTEVEKKAALKAEIEKNRAKGA